MQRVVVDQKGRKHNDKEHDYQSKTHINKTEDIHLGFCLNWFDDLKVEQKRLTDNLDHDK